MFIAVAAKDVGGFLGRVGFYERIETLTSTFVGVFLPTRT
jgi:hypothetical protein